jgi:LCP family protein required for cell wall assembly
VTKVIDAVTQKSKLVYLLVGIDDVADNTDVICAVSYDESDNTIRVLQIPRDTYFDFGFSQRKINQIFSTKTASGMDKTKALAETTSEIAKALGVEFDGFAGIGTLAFRNIIDAIGGVDIDLPYDINISSSEDDVTLLKKGINHLDGTLAEKFVRYRQGYIMGDLSRVDAQKLFISAVISKVKNDISFTKLIEIASIYHRDVVSDIRLNSGLEILSAMMSRGGTSIYYATMPGEPALSENNLSFYVLNRKSSAEIVKKYLFAENEFDFERRFVRSDNIAFLNIYNDEDFVAREFCDEDLENINIR